MFERVGTSTGMGPDKLEWNEHNTHLSHLSGVQVQDSDCMVVSVGYEECRPLRPHT